MAKQKGLIKLEGTIGDLTFYKSKEGYLAKGKSEISPERIANDPAFARTRENNAEFGVAGMMAKAVRLGLNNRNSKGSQARLASLLLALVKTDTVNMRGQRNLSAITDFSRLLGFSFNLQAKFSEVVLGGKIEADTNFNAVFSQGMLNPPPGATHYDLYVQYAVIQKQTGELLAAAANNGGGTLPIPPDNSIGPVLVNLTPPALNAGELQLFAGGVNFYQEVNGTLYPLLDDSKAPFYIYAYRTL